MGKIVLLDDLTINQIAAGEVIERPASVIKEMVENSIDAGAKNICVEIKNGGISLIRITDDGCGIAEDDMEIAFERHATSKIRQAADLETVQTMGFRGEALASIAAIANVEMVSKTANDEIGHRILVEGGKILDKSEVGCQNGTRITVQNLFYNTPVRYKFLKKDYTEAGYIEDVITRIALVNKDVAIKLINNGKVLVQTNGSGDSKNIIYSIYGKDVASGIVDVDYTYEDIKVTGVVGKPEIARSNRSNQIFFVNGRYVRDKNLTAAAEQAYKGMIPIGKFGFVILNLEMDPKKVDVNVHPAKLEVRFEEETKVFKSVYHAIKSGLGQIELIANVVRTTENENLEEAKTENIKSEVKEESSFDTNNEEDKFATQKVGIANLFKKLIKEPDETEEELNNNKLMDIYNARHGVSDATMPLSPVQEIVKQVVEEIKPEVGVEGKNETVLEHTASNPVDEEKLEEAKVANEEIIDKSITIGETAISSNTRELDFDITEALKEKTLTLDSTKKVEIQETQVIPTTRETVSQETQTISSTKEAMETEAQSVEEEKILQIANEENATNGVIEVNSNEKTLEATVPSLEAVESITAKILEMKMSSLDNTQIIDTSKVREALNESSKITPEFADMYKKTFGLEANEIRKERELEAKEREKINVSKEFINAENTSIFENEEVYNDKINYKFIGIVFNTYIIIEFNNEMYIIDQHAAHERIMYEKVKANYYNDESKDSQFLLLPDIVTVTYREMSLARENVELFEKAGFAFEEFGDNTLKLTAVPSMCEDLNTKNLFLDVLDEIDTVAVTARQEKEEKFISTVACKAAVKAKMKLDEKEVDSLMQKLLSIPNPFTCPHGRPTAIKMGKTDIEKKFARRK